MTIGDWIQVGMLVVAIASMIATIIYTHWSTKKNVELAMKQMNVQIFSEYTRRYNEVIKNIPTGDTAYKYTKGYEKDLTQYFNLCSEEFHLWIGNMIDDEIWKIWEEGMRAHMKKSLFRTIWEKQKKGYDETFRDYFEREVINWKASKWTYIDICPTMTT